jgi:hypothetical protein
MAAFHPEPPPQGTKRQILTPRYHIALRHYEGHALEHRHVVERARIDSDYIGGFA